MYHLILTPSHNYCSVFHYIKPPPLLAHFPPTITALHQGPPLRPHNHHRSRRRTTGKMRSAAAYYSGGEYHQQQPHFLDSCFLCHKPLSQNSDIYMYRGNTPFCSQECRQEQIEMDETNEKRWKISSSSSSSSSKRSTTVRQNKDSTKESDTNKAVRTGTVAVA